MGKRQTAVTIHLDPTTLRKFNSVVRAEWGQRIRGEIFREALDLWIATRERQRGAPYLITDGPGPTGRPPGATNNEAE